MDKIYKVAVIILWMATICAWYAVNKENNRYIVTNGFVLDIEQQRYIKVGKRHWEKLSETADEQLDRFGRVVFEDYDYKFLKHSCRLSDKEWDYAVLTGGSGKEIFEEIRSQRKQEYDERVAYDAVLSMDDRFVKIKLGYFTFAVDEGYTSWRGILERLNKGDNALDIAKDLREAESSYARILNRKNEERHD